MALTKQVVPVSFGKGINTKVDPKQLTGALIECENGYQEETGSLRLRNGYIELSNEIIDGYSLTSASDLANFNDELLLTSDESLFSYAPRIEQWADKGSLVFTDVTSEAAISNSYEQTSCDLAVTRRVAIYAWEDSRGGVYSTVKDLDSGASFIQETLLNENAIRPRCFGIGQYLFVYYYDTVEEELRVRRVDTASPTSYSDEVIVANDINTTSPFFDVCLVGTSRMVVAYLNDVGTLRLAYFLQNNTVGTTLQGVPDPESFPAYEPDTCITCYPGLNSSSLPTFYVAFGNSLTGIHHVGFYSNFDIYKADVVLDGYVLDARNITGIAYEDVSDVYYEVPASSPLDHYIGTNQVTVSSNTANLAYVLQRSGGLAAKAYERNGFSSIIVVHEASFQNTYFAIGNRFYLPDNDSIVGDIEAKALPNLAGNLTINDSCIAGTWLVDEGHLFACNKQTRDDVEASENLVSFYQTTIDYDSSRLGKSYQLGLNTFFPGGYIQAYDGEGTIEQNFHLYPDEPVIDAYGSGLIADGYYSYAVTFGWIDAQGQIWESAQSVPVTFEVTSGPKELELTIPTLRYTAKCFPRSPVFINVYRTEEGGEIYYQVTSDSNPLYNDVQTDSVTFLDNISDTALLTRRPLYTEAQLDNAPFPASRVICATKTRLFAATDKNEINYSKEYVPGISVPYALENTLQIDPKGGDITAIAEMDEKVIIFKQSGINYITGNGPNNNGQGELFQVYSVATSVGTISPKTIVEFPSGLLFKSTKGIWLLDRALETHYLGNEVQAYNLLSITSAVNVPDLNQVRFTTLEGTTLVYDYYYKEWRTFTNQVSISATTWQDTYVFARPTGLVWQEDPESFADNNVPIIPKFGTEWFKFAGIQGYQRIQRMQILGEYKGTHVLKISVHYDFNPTATDIFYYHPEMGGFGLKYGALKYGIGSYGYSEGAYNFQIDFSRQKCQSMKLVIEAVYPESTGTAAFTISAISFLVGVKANLNRLSPNKQMT